MFSDGNWPLFMGQQQETSKPGRSRPGHLAENGLRQG
jgi:hypothetical protein